MERESPITAVEAVSDDTHAGGLPGGIENPTRSNATRPGEVPGLYRPDLLSQCVNIP